MLVGNKGKKHLGDYGGGVINSGCRIYPHIRITFSVTYSVKLKHVSSALKSDVRLALSVLRDVFQFTFPVPYGKPGPCLDF